MSMSLRNELRQPLLDQQLFSESYNWRDWYTYMKQGASAINSANPDVLIFLSGLDSDTTLQPVVQGTSLTPGSATFDFNDFPPRKLVLELHNYANILGGSEANNCTMLTQDLYEDGFEALQTEAHNIFPVVMTEYGFQQDDETWQGTFASCLERYLADQQAGWMIWDLPGSYYIREGTQDGDEPWGLLTHNWSDWRSPGHIRGGLASLVAATLAANGIQISTNNSQNGNTSDNSSSQASGGTSPHATATAQGLVTLSLLVLGLSLFLG
jgi:hypothetical protein